MSENTVKFDIPEWVNWLARDSNGALYGFVTKPEKFSEVWSIADDSVEDRLMVFITEDPNHYPQVKWADEEPKQYKDGITFTTGTHKAETFVPSAMKDTVSADGLWRTQQDQPSVEPEPDMIQNPPHYKQYSFEPIDIITEVVKEYPPEIGFHVGTTLKYLFRSPFKGNLHQDLEKAEYYLQRANKELSE